MQKKFTTLQVVSLQKVIGIVHLQVLGHFYSPAISGKKCLFTTQPIIGGAIYSPTFFLTYRTSFTPL